MAKLNKDSLIHGLSGKLGKHLVVRQRQEGDPVVAGMPDFSNRVFSGAQLAQQSRFQQAAAYAARASQENPLYARLAAGRSHSAYNLALSDWSHPPVIHQVIRQDGCVRVLATDNVLVARVRVTLFDEHGRTLEAGQATRVKMDCWAFETTASGARHVLVEAFDLAGNLARYEA